MINKFQNVNFLIYIYIYIYILGCAKCYSRVQPGNDVFAIS